MFKYAVTVLLLLAACEDAVDNDPNDPNISIDLPDDIETDNDPNISESCPGGYLDSATNLCWLLPDCSLRLNMCDEDIFRHYKQTLVCAYHVCKAYDMFLPTIPEIESLQDLFINNDLLNWYLQCDEASKGFIVTSELLGYGTCAYSLEKPKQKKYQDCIEEDINCVYNEICDDVEICTDYYMSLDIKTLQDLADECSGAIEAYLAEPESIGQENDLRYCLTRTVCEDAWSRISANLDIICVKNLN